MKKIFKILIILSVSSTPLLSSAAVFGVDKNNISPSDSSELFLDVYVDTEGEAINTFAGELFIPDFIQVKKIYYGNSIINTWIQTPEYINNSIIFSGVVPGGFERDVNPLSKLGTKGLLFQALVSIENREELEQGKGEKELLFLSAEAFLNDGEGTSAKVKFKEIDVTKSVGGSSYEVPVVTDRLSPESINYEISRDRSIFNNKYFVSFYSEDRHSGVNRYEICESWLPLPYPYTCIGKWYEASSPYLLTDQSLRSDIYIKIYDVENNVYTKVIYPKHSSVLYTFYLIGIILLLVFYKYYIKR